MAMKPVEVWTGFEAKQLRDALRLTVVVFASSLGISPRTVNKWEARGRGITPLPEMQAVLDTALRQAPEETQRRFHASINSSPAGSRTAQPRNDKHLKQSARWQPLAAREQEEDWAGAPQDAAWALVEFTRSDMSTRREFLELSLLTGASLVAPIRRWAATVPLVPVMAGKAGTDEIHELERAVALFRRWDAAGSGLHRKAVIGQLNAVAESLHADRRPAVRERLFYVAAELAQLAGWMTFDGGLHVAAQRYFLFGLKASQHANRSDLAAKIVGDMAQLSKFLGHNEDSLAMLRTTLATLPRSSNSLVRAELSAHQACAHARFGPPDASDAQRSIEGSLEAFDEATTDDRTNWLLYMDRAEASSLAASAYIQLARNDSGSTRGRSYAERAERHALEANQQRQTNRVRSRVFDEIRLSKVRLAQSEPEEAASIAHNAISLAGQVRSSSVVKRLCDVYKDLGDGYGDLSAVQEFRSGLLDYVRAVEPARERELRA